VKNLQKNNPKIFTFILILIMIGNIATLSCKKKKNTSTIDLEAIEYDGSKNERYLFREELKKEKMKKEKEKTMLKKIEEEVPK